MQDERFPPADSRGFRPRGFTLVEVMMATMIIGTSAFAALAGLLFAYRTSDSHLRALAAMANARSVAEQILTLDASTLGSDTLPVDIPASTVGSLKLNEWNARTVDIHDTPLNEADDLKMSLWPEVIRPNPATGFICTQVIIRFQWTENSFFAPRTREDALTVVISNVPIH